MGSNLEQLKRATESSGITAVENAIAAKMGFSIYKGNFDKLLSSLNEDVENSNMELDKLERYVAEHPEKVEEFTHLFLEKDNIKSISFGFSLKYAVYMIYLIEKTEAELYSYIVKQRIPQAK